MRRHLPLMAALAALVAPAPAGAQERPECDGADVEAATTVNVAAAAVLCIVNVERTLRGLPPVIAEGRLDRAAQGHSEDMVARRYFAHVAPDGQTPADRAGAQGYPYASLHENIAVGQRTARGVMRDWMASASHCTAVLAPEVEHLGVGIAQGGRRGTLWTQNLALLGGNPAPSSDRGPADGCPYDRLLVAPGPAVITILALGRTGNRVTVLGALEESGAGRRIVLVARRAGRSRRKEILTRSGGGFRTTVRAPRGRGRVRLTITAPAVAGVYDTGRARGRI